MSATFDELLHALVDTACGRRNISHAQADEFHEVVTPGYTAKPVSEDELSAALEVIKRAEADRAKRAAADATAV